MRTAWIVVADAGRARILSQVGRVAALSVVQELDNPSGRAHNVDLVTDQPGRFQKTGSNVGSAMDPPTDPHEEQAREFAHKLNHLVEAAATAGTFDDLVMVAPAHFLGLLQSGMKPASRKRLIASLSHDYARVSLPELQGHLKDLLEFSKAKARSQ
jgi:protein required for attachment to host cells